jgi:hypothetical protein
MRRFAGSPGNPWLEPPFEAGSFADRADVTTYRDRLTGRRELASRLRLIPLRVVRNTPVLRAFAVGLSVGVLAGDLRDATPCSSDSSVR